MSYTKTVWVDGDNRYDIKTQASAVISADIKLIYVGTAAGTAISQTVMNNIESGIEDAHLAIENPTYESEESTTEPITSLASTVLKSPLKTATIKGNTINGYDDNTKLLLYFEGTDESTTFTDQTGKTVVASGDAQIDTAQKRWGTSSGLFDGTDDYLTVTDANSDLDIGTSDFTIEFWIRWNSLSSPSVQSLIDLRISSDTDVGLNIYQTGSNIYFFTDNVNKISGTTTLINNVWYHIALVKTGGYTKMYSNGIQEGSSYADTNNYISISNMKVASRYDGVFAFNGWIDELRISNTARYTTSFSPQGLNLLSSDKMRVTSVGKNLFGTYLELGVLNTSTGAEEVLAGIIRSGWIGGIKGSTAYYCEGNSNSANLRVYYYDEFRNYLGTDVGLVSDYVSFTTPSACYYVRFVFSTSTFGFSPMLELGNSGSTYEPYTETSSIITPTLRSVSPTIQDEYDCNTGIHTKNVSDVVTLSGNAYTWVFDVDGTGYKRSYITGFTYGGGGTGGIQVFKYNNKTISPITYGSMNAGDQCAFTSSNAFTITFSDTDTGWLEAWTSGTSFTGLTWGGLIKAYMNGWKLTTANVDVASCVWTGIASGTTKSGSSGYSDVTTTIDTGFQPYRMIYQLATPITEQYYPSILNSNPSGSIIVSPQVEDVGVYSTNLAIINSSYPISSMEYVSQIDTDTGTLTPISLTDITIAADGLTFTISSAVSGDYYLYAYNYVGLSSRPTLTYVTTNNLKATVNELSNEVINLNKKVEQQNIMTNSNLDSINTILESAVAKVNSSRRDSINLHMGGWRIG